MKTYLNNEGEPMTSEEIQDQLEYERQYKEHYISWLAHQKSKKFTVIVDGTSGIESPPMNSVAECEKWVSENLPIGTQRFRTGSYSIGEVE